MAHNLNYNQQTGKHSFVAVGEKAWHGLGTYVDEAMTAEQAIELGGLNFSVNKRPLYTPSTDPDRLPLEVPGMYATVRDDNEQVLGIVSKDYHIIQNSEAFEFFDSIVDRGEAIYQTAGALGKGERIFITAKLPSDILVHGEQVENYLLLTSGHDGKSAIQAGFTSIRVVCNNTLTAALRGLQNKITILHFSNAKQKLHTASKVMGMASKYVTELNPLFNQMASVRITDKQLRSYIEQVMKPSKETINPETLQVEYSKLFTKKVDEILEFAHTNDTQLTEAAKGTVWGAYNAISGYYGHVKKYKSQEEKMQDLYFKAGAKKIEAAFDLALTFIN